MNKKYVAGGVLVAIVVAVLFIGVPNLETNTEKIKIGVLLPLTGPAASVAEDLQKTLVMYQAEAKNIEFVFQDDQCSPKHALSGYQLLKEQGARVYIGACSGSILALAPVLKEDGNVMLTGFGGSIEIRQTGDEVIRFIPDGLSVAEAMVELLKKDEGKRYALLHEQSDYPQSAAAVISEALGSHMVIHETYLGDDTSMRTQLIKIQTANPDALIFIPVAEGAAQVVYKEMYELGLNVPIVGDVNVCDHAIPAQELGLHGMCTRTVLKTAGYDAYIQAFTELHGAEPTYPFYNAITYDVARTIDLELAGLGELSNEELGQFKQRVLDGVTGSVTTYAFQPNGDVIPSNDYLEIVDF